MACIRVMHTATLYKFSLGWSQQQQASQQPQPI